MGRNVSLCSNYILWLVFKAGLNLRNREGQMSSIDQAGGIAGGTLDPDGHKTLNPVGSDEKTWGWFATFNIWANDVQSLFGYSLVASLFISFGVVLFCA